MSFAKYFFQIVCVIIRRGPLLETLFHFYYLATLGSIQGEECVQRTLMSTSELRVLWPPLVEALRRNKADVVSKGMSYALIISG